MTCGGTSFPARPESRRRNQFRRLGRTDPMKKFRVWILVSTLWSYLAFVLVSRSTHASNWTTLKMDSAVSGWHDTPRSWCRQVHRCGADICRRVRGRQSGGPGSERHGHRHFRKSAAATSRPTAAVPPPPWRWEIFVSGFQRPFGRRTSRQPWWRVRAMRRTWGRRWRCTVPTIVGVIRTPSRPSRRLI